MVATGGRACGSAPAKEGTPSGDQASAYQLATIAKQLQQLAEQQQRIERELKRRNSKASDEATILERRLNEITDLLNAPGANAVLTLTLVLTAITGVGVATRASYEAYQSVIATIPGQQWGERGTAPAPALNLDDAKVMAFLDLIAWAEGTNDDYNVIFTHARFEGNAHPRQIKCSGSLCSDAAGRYQFLSSTWDGLGLPDFSPANQDKGAIALLKQSGAYDLVLKGDVQGAIAKASGTWASFPGNSYGQPTKPIDQLLSKYNEFLEKRKTAAAGSSGWINPLPSGQFTSGFGYRMHPLAQYRRCHYGIDLAAPSGVPILAAKAGRVAIAADEGDGYGNKVVLHHADGSRSLYAHASKLMVQAGQQVNQGDAIALNGSTGNSSGPHLHWEATDTSGMVVDPLPLLPEPPKASSNPFGSIDKSASAQCMEKRL